MVRIITNADDFGYDEDTFNATRDALLAGDLTSATIMPKMPATPEAVEFARAHPELSWGVHLTFARDTVEAPVLPPAELPALVEADGGFPPSNRVRLRALLRRLPVDQIEREIAAQIQCLLDQGVSISHVDTHGHMHKFWPFRVALEHVLPPFGIQRVRSVQNVYVSRPLRSPTYWCGPLWRSSIQRAFRTTDDFFMSTGPADADWPDTVLLRTRGRSLEVGVHPGRTETWRQAEWTGLQRFVRNVRAAGHPLIRWKDL